MSWGNRVLGVCFLTMWFQKESSWADGQKTTIVLGPADDTLGTDQGVSGLSCEKQDWESRCSTRASWDLNKWMQHARICEEKLIKTLQAVEEHFQVIVEFLFVHFQVILCPQFVCIVVHIKALSISMRRRMLLSLCSHSSLSMLINCNYCLWGFLQAFSVRCIGWKVIT